GLLCRAAVALHLGLRPFLRRRQGCRVFSRIHQNAGPVQNEQRGRRGCYRILTRVFVAVAVPNPFTCAPPILAHLSSPPNSARHKSASGMVRPCSCSASVVSGKGCQTRSTSCPRTSAAQLP